MTRRRIAWLVLMIIVMGVIFYFSNQPVEQSHAISNAVAEEIHVEGNQWYEAAGKPLLFGLNLRKWAHVGLYAVLGLTAWFGFKSLWKSLGICYAYACIDEVHQIFISGRTASITDTFIDALGFGTAIILSCVIAYIFKCIKKKSKHTKSV